MKREELLEKAKSWNCTVQNGLQEPDSMYGTYEDLDQMVDSENVNDRIRIAELGYGLEKLKDDANEDVRVAVAKHGIFTSQFITDSSEKVRNAVK